MNRRAVIFGAGGYTDPQINPLPGAEPDCASMAGLLREHAGFEVQAYIGAEACRQANLRQAIREAAEGMQPGDVLVIYAALHATTTPVGQFLVCPQARLRDLNHHQTDDALSLALLAEETSRPGLQRVFLLDACRKPLPSGERRVGQDDVVVFNARNLVGADSGLEASDEEFSPLTIFSACEKGSAAQEIPGLARGLFTLAFENVVADRLARGVAVPVDDVFADEVRREMARLARQHQLAGRQKPSRTHVGPAIELIRAPGAADPPPRPVPASILDSDPPPIGGPWEPEPETAPKGSYAWVWLFLLLLLAGGGYWGWRQWQEAGAAKIAAQALREIAAFSDLTNPDAFVGLSNRITAVAIRLPAPHRGRVEQALTDLAKKIIPPVPPPDTNNAVVVVVPLGFAQTTFAIRYRTKNEPLAYEIYSGGQLLKSGMAGEDFTEQLPFGPIEVHIGPPAGDRFRDWLLVRRTLQVSAETVWLDFRRATVVLNATRDANSVVRHQAWRSNRWGVVELSVGDTASGSDSSSVDRFTDNLLAVPSDYIVSYPRHHPDTVPIEPVPTLTIERPVKLVPFSAPVVGQRTSNSAGMDLVPFAGFWVSATETTLAQFARFAAATKLPELPMLSLTKHGRRDIGRTWRQPWISTNDGMTRPLTNDPVVGVSWSEAVAFCRWLTEHERARGIISARQAYALPSRAHWTAFAGSARFPWGNDTRLLRPDRRFLGNFAGLEVRKGLWAEQWFEGWSYLGGPIGADDFGPEEWGRYDDGFARTAPVGSFRRPDDDLADVAGNALEWGADPDPTQPGRRAVLGSCWFDDQLADLETAAVRWYPEELRDSRLGFRVLLIETTTP